MISMTRSLKNSKAKLGLLTDIDMLLMVEKGIRSGICHAIHRYEKAKNKCMKEFDKMKESSYLKCLHINNLYRWAMPQKLQFDGFKWVKETSQFNENFIKIYSEDSIMRYFFQVDVQYPEVLHEIDNDFPFLLERIKIEKIEKLLAILYDKKEYFIHTRI